MSSLSKGFLCYSNLWNVSLVSSLGRRLVETVGNVFARQDLTDTLQHDNAVAIVALCSSVLDMHCLHI